MRVSKSSLDCSQEMQAQGFALLEAMQSGTIHAIDIATITTHIDAVFEHYFDNIHTEISRDDFKEANQLGLYFVTQSLLALMEVITNIAVTKNDLLRNRAQIEDGLQLLASIQNNLQSVIDKDGLNSDLQKHFRVISKIVLVIGLFMKGQYVDILEGDLYDCDELIQAALKLSKNPLRIPNMYDKKVCNIEVVVKHLVHDALLRILTRMFVMGFSTQYRPNQALFQQIMLQFDEDLIARMPEPFSRVCQAAVFYFSGKSDLKVAWNFLRYKDRLYAALSPHQQHIREQFVKARNVFVIKLLHILTRVGPSLKFVDYYAYYKMLQALKAEDDAIISNELFADIRSFVNRANAKHWSELKKCRDKVKLSIPGTKLNSKAITLEIPCAFANDYRFVKLLSKQVRKMLREVNKAVPSYHYVSNMLVNAEANLLIITGLRTTALEYIHGYCDTIIQTMHSYREQLARKQALQLVSMLERSLVCESDVPVYELADEKPLTGFMYQQQQKAHKQKTRATVYNLEDLVDEGSSSEAGPLELFGPSFASFDIRQLHMLSSNNAQIFVAQLPDGLQQDDFDKNIQNRFGRLFECPMQARPKNDQGFKFREVNGSNCPVAKILKSDAKTLRALPCMAVKGKDRAVLYIYNKIAPKNRQAEAHHKIIEVDWEDPQLQTALEKIGYQPTKPAPAMT